MTIVVNFGYRHYLTTDAWREKRNERLRHDNWRCARCSSQELLQVHHRSYERVGRERIEDLESLCRRCHMLEHRKDPDLPAAMPQVFYQRRAAEREFATWWHEIVITAFDAGKALEELFEMICELSDPRAENIRRNLHALMRMAAKDCDQEWEPSLKEAA